MKNLEKLNIFFTNLNYSIIDKHSISYFRKNNMDLSLLIDLSEIISKYDKIEKKYIELSEINHIPIESIKFWIKEYKILSKKEESVRVNFENLNSYLVKCFLEVNNFKKPENIKNIVFEIIKEVWKQGSRHPIVWYIYSKPNKGGLYFYTDSTKILSYLGLEKTTNNATKIRKAIVELINDGKIIRENYYDEESYCWYKGIIKMQ